MKLISLENLKLDRSLDFKPLSPWPESLPVVVTGKVEAPSVVAGFEHLNCKEGLFIDKPSLVVLKDLWPENSLKPFERLRFLRTCGHNLDEEAAATFSYPLEFQNFCDQKSISPKSLRPLTFMKDWEDDIMKSIIQFSPTSSEVREIIDCLCDLKFAGKTWDQCYQNINSPSTWLSYLKKTKTPLTVGTDEASSRILKSTSFPKGVNAQWERRGDQAGVAISMKIFSSEDWEKIKTNLDKIKIDESLWN